MKAEIINFTKGFGNTLTANSPTILTGFAVAGLFTTVVLAVRATPRAIELLDERAELWEANNQELSNWDCVQTVYKEFIPTLIMGTLTVGCIIGANSINLRRNAALAGAYSLTERALKAYQTQIVEVVGPKEALKIKESIAKKAIDNNPVSKNEVIITGAGDVLCYDTGSGRYFMNNIENIRRIRNDINSRIFREGFVSLNDFYYELGLKSITLGDDIGWHIERDCNIDCPTSHITDDGRPCLVIDYSTSPKFRNY